MSNLKLSWGDRLALIAHFKPTTEQVCAAFNVTRDELETANSLLQQGTFAPTQGIDFAKYDGIFASVAPSAEAAVAASQTKSTQAPSSVNPAHVQSMTATASAPLRKTGNATSYAKPETASKPVKAPQKRGRKGDKITTALAAVPTTPVSAEEFSKQHNVSIAVLRQSKRFLEKMDPETRNAIGKINVRQDKATKTLMIYREVSTS